MFLDPNKLDQYSPAEILDSAARGHLGLDQRFVRALADRPAEALPAAVAFAARDRSQHEVDLAPDLVALFRHWKTPEAIPFLVDYVREDPEDVPDEAIEALVELGEPALEPLIALYDELEESQSGEVAFILANLRIRDDRVLQLLTDRLSYDLPDTVLLLSIYGDAAAIPALESAAQTLGPNDSELKNEIGAVREALTGTQGANEERDSEEAFDLWAGYPEIAQVPVDLLNEDERAELLEHPVAEVRAAAANSFFNRDLNPALRTRLLEVAQEDENSVVRARAWEALTSATEHAEVVEVMLVALRRADLPAEERGGLLVGLSPEADRNEVRAAMEEHYRIPEGRAKALEAMWRSVHPSFRDNFARHLDDSELEIRRAAVWGVGYYGLRSELEKLRSLFDDEELRSDALFAYALAVPAEVSRGRMKGLLTRIDRDAHGLSEMEEELVKAALDERLMLAGKEPFFTQEDD